MAETVIRVENLGKKYIIGHQKQERYTALRDVLAEKARGFSQFFSRNGKRNDPSHEEFWALKDVSFEVKQGDRIGIIGRNGAGKSTLLKILSRITEPTEGRIKIKGRVASLLEVGTGFHPELTGRENIYLNGAILGMSKREISRKFDEIVAFAEVEKFLDTPVKRYSSGMYVRLAFAVAAHLEPEILVVDEVLAMGDAQFQKKCLGKMEDVSKGEGRTILFVSHQMAAIQNLCSTGLFLKNGKNVFLGDIESTISNYVNDSQYQEIQNLSMRLDRKGSGEIKATKIIIKALDSETIQSGKDIKVDITLYSSVNHAVSGTVVSIDIVDALDVILLMHRSNFQDEFFNFLPGKSQLSCIIKRLPLCAGTYYLNFYLARSDVHPVDWIYRAAEFTVEDSNFFGKGINGMPGHCKILNDHFWQFNPPMEN